MTALSEQLRQFRERFEPSLEAFFEQVMETQTADFTVASEMLVHIRELTMRPAKRVRPALFEVVANGYPTGLYDAQLLQLACAPEVMQSGLLILDDIMDQSRFRRGKLSLHEIYAHHEGREHDLHHGESMALLAGVAASFLGQQAIESVDLPPEHKLALIGLYRQVMVDESFGQALDLSLEIRQRPDPGMVMNMYRYKTARYTGELSLEMVALVAGLDAAEREHLRLIGEHLGVAFQIQDDIIGTFGEEAKTGKSVLSDAAEGKRTLLYARAVEQLSLTDRKRFLSLYGNEALTEEGLQEVRALIDSTDALAVAQHEMETRIDTIKALVPNLTCSQEAKDFLLGMAGYVVGREW